MFKFITVALIFATVAACNSKTGPVDAQKEQERLYRLSQIEKIDDENRKRKLTVSEPAKYTYIPPTCSTKGSVHLGMTKEYAYYCGWGAPTHINTTTNINGTNEQWVYNSGYLYFNNGILTSVQTHN